MAIACAAFAFLVAESCIFFFPTLKVFFLICLLTKTEVTFCFAKSSFLQQARGGISGEHQVLKKVGDSFRTHHVPDNQLSFWRSSSRPSQHDWTGEPFFGAYNSLSYKIPKLLFRDGMRCLPSENSGSAQGFYEKWVKSRFSIFSPENVHSSSLGARSDEFSSCSGAFGLIRMLDLSVAEASFLSRASSLERLLFAVLRSEEPPSVVLWEFEQRDNIR